MSAIRFSTIAVILAVFGVGGSAFAAAGETDVDPSAPVSTLDLAFDLYAGGIPLGHASMSARLQGTDYKAISTLDTRGIVNAFWQSKIETSASGTLNAQNVRPRLYDSFSQYRSAERRQVTLNFGPEGPSVFSNPPYDKPSFAVTDAEKKQSLDPLSAVLFLIGSGADTTKPCDAVAPIFDGRRRYDVGFDFVKKTDVHMDNGLYDGPAFVCRVHYAQVAGYQQTLVSAGKKLPDIFAWVAPLRGTADPNRHYMVPLRVWAETEYGIVVALASQLKLDGRAFGTRG